MDSNINTNNNTQPAAEEALEIGFKICSCEKNPGGPCTCPTAQSSQPEKTEAITNKKHCCRSKDGNNLCSGGGHKLEVFDWLYDSPEAQESTQMIEVQFKNTRKGYYLNSNNLELHKGDIVAVESVPGHDIGEVTLTGKLVLLQMKKTNYRPQNGEQRRVYRIAKQSDIEKADSARALEHKTMLRAREIAEELRLQMKISDVEYQGDGNKAIFYYIADERVDFRQLIKVYAEQFRVKIEMKQIGARQEAGRVGGIGPCGRELCCSGSISSFVSVSTSAARHQDISLNPLKLAGQCGKLKCCLNYEVDVYVEAQRKLPPRDVVLEARDSSFFHFKTDILSGQMTYSTDKYFAANLVTIDKDRVFEIIRMNKKGQKPSLLAADVEVKEEKPMGTDVLEQESITRFDGMRNNNNKRKKKLSKPNGDGTPNNNRERSVGQQLGGQRNSENPNRRPPQNRPNKEPREAVTGEPRANDENKGGNNNNQRRNNQRRNTNKPFRNNNGKDASAESKPNSTSE